MTTPTWKYTAAPFLTNTNQTSQHLNCFPHKPSPALRWIKDWLKCQPQGEGGQCLVVCPRGRHRGQDNLTTSLMSCTLSSPWVSLHVELRGVPHTPDGCAVIQRDWTGWGIGQRRISWSSTEGNAQFSIWRGGTPCTNMSQECTLQQRRAAASQTASAVLPGHPFLSAQHHRGLAAVLLLLWAHWCRRSMNILQGTQKMAMEMAERTGASSHGNRVRELGLLSLGREQLSRHPISINLWWETIENVEPNFCQGQEKKQRAQVRSIKFYLSRGKAFYGQILSQVAREAGVQSSSVRRFKVQLDKVLPKTLKRTWCDSGGVLCRTRSWTWWSWLGPFHEIHWFYDPAHDIPSFYHPADDFPWFYDPALAEPG